MLLTVYEQAGRAIYSGLAEVVSKILAAAVEADQLPHPQQIQHRAKEVLSLRKKLAKAGATEADEIEPHAKDLAGVRLIFYTNSDVSKFQSSGVLRDNFEIDWDRTKIHHPTADNAPASELFVSNNYVVRLKDGRAALPEYAPFAGLWCEIQVQTTLNHAWAEMARGRRDARASLWVLCRHFGAQQAAASPLEAERSASRLAIASHATRRGRTGNRNPQRSTNASRSRPAGHLAYSEMLTPSKPS